LDYFVWQRGITPLLFQFEKYLSSGAVVSNVPQINDGTTFQVRIDYMANINNNWITNQESTNGIVNRGGRQTMIIQDYLDESGNSGSVVQW